MEPQVTALLFLLFLHRLCVLARAKDGDEEAISELFAPYDTTLALDEKGHELGRQEGGNPFRAPATNKLYGLALKNLYNGNTPKAEQSILRQYAMDAVVGGVTQAWKSIKSFKGNSKFETWLTRIVINEAEQILRHETADKRDRSKIISLDAQITDGPKQVICGYNILEDADIAGTAQPNGMYNKRFQKLQELEEFKEAALKDDKASNYDSDKLQASKTKMFCPTHKAVQAVLGYTADQGYTLDCGCTRRLSLDGTPDPARRASPSVTPVSPNIADSNESAAEASVLVERRDWVEEQFKHLTAAERSVVLGGFNGLTDEEIQSEYRISRVTIPGHRSRALAKLKKLARQL